VAQRSTFPLPARNGGEPFVHRAVGSLTGWAQKLVAVSFFLLAPYVAVEATHTLAVEHHAETTRLGIGLSAGTLCMDERRLTFAGRFANP
jgi:hypothetical protein